MPTVIVADIRRYRKLVVRGLGREGSTPNALRIELDENAIADKIGHDWRNPDSYDTDDGSAVDW